VNVLKRRAFKRKKIGRLVITAILLLYIATKIWPFLNDASNKTIVVPYGKIEEKVSVNAYVIRDEKVISNIKEFSDVEFLVEEGKMVAKGQEIAKFYLTDDNNSTVEKDLKTLEERIDSINEQQSQSGHFQGDINKLNDQIQSNVNQIQTYINNGEFDKVNNAKNDLAVLLDKKSVIAGDSSFTGINLSELENQRNQLSSKLNSHVKIVNATIPGYFALGSDGLEEIFNLTNIEQIDFDSFKLLQENKGKDKSSTAIRIVNNFKYNLVIELDNTEMNGLEEGKFVTLRDKSAEEREYRARVRKVISDESNDKSIVVLSIKEHMDSVFSSRILELDLLKNVYEGITVPNKSIIEVEGQTGVFKVDINGFIKFVPVMVKGRNDDESIVYSSHFDTTIDGESKRILTISSYDEIVLDGNGLSDGQKIR